VHCLYIFHHDITTPVTSTSPHRTVGLLVLRINQRAALFYQFRQLVDVPLCPLFQRVIDAFASIVCPAGAADLHVLPLQRFNFLFRNTAAVLATRAGRGRFAPCVHFALVSNAA